MSVGRETGEGAAMLPQRVPCARPDVGAAGAALEAASASRRPLPDRQTSLPREQPRHRHSPGHGGTDRAQTASLGRGTPQLCYTAFKSMYFICSDISHIYIILVFSLSLIWKGTKCPLSQFGDVTKLGVC